MAGRIQPRLRVFSIRYLCAREPGYLESLSADSARSLVLQGGVFDADEAEAFGAQPYALDAMALRRWDDLAKSADARVPGLAHFVRHLHIAAAEHRAATALPAHATE